MIKVALAAAALLGAAVMPSTRQRRRPGSCSSR